MFNEANDYTLLDGALELSSDDLDLVLGGDGPSTAQQETQKDNTQYGPPPPPPPPAPTNTTNIDVGKVNVDINVDAKVDATGLSDSAGHTVQELGHEVAQDMAEVREIVHEIHTSDTAGSLDNLISRGLDWLASQIPSSEGSGH